MLETGSRFQVHNLKMEYKSNYNLTKIKAIMDFKNYINNTNYANMTGTPVKYAFLKKTYLNQ